jgi:hypothetical protein
MRLNNISQNITEEVASKEAWAKLKSRRKLPPKGRGVLSKTVTDDEELEKYSIMLMAEKFKEKFQ